MADKSKIEWTDATWNPVRGCTRVSPGCGGPGKAGGCYAEKIAARFSEPGQPFHGFAERTKDGGRWTGKVALVENALELPLRWKKPRRVFVNSMSDLFHDGLPNPAIDRVFAIMARCPQHQFQVLTKRAERMRDYLIRHDVGARWAMAATTNDVMPTVGDAIKWTRAGLPNVWLGTSAERQQEADERIPFLLDTPATVRFVSLEPLLGPIDLTRLCVLPQKPDSIRAGIHVDALRNKHSESQVKRGIGPLDWVIVGGESGPRARPMHPDWARSVRDQCAAASVPFFFKQWGEYLPWSQFNEADVIDDEEQTKFLTHEWDNGAWRDVGHPMWCDSTDGNIDADHCVGRVGKKLAGNVLDGREHKAFPEALAA